MKKVSDSKEESNPMAHEHVLSRSVYTATINAQIEKVDIADLLFNLPDAEYQRCHPAHIACGITTADDGKQMTINVETIGDALVIQHYVAEVKTPHLCRMVSQSDSITAAGRTKLQVTWELSVRKIDANTCEYSNLVHSIATDVTLAFFAKHNIPFERAAAARQEASSNHNREETPHFASSIERRALGNGNGTNASIANKAILVTTILSWCIIGRVVHI